jgi:hypothetical protein
MKPGVSNQARGAVGAGPAPTAERAAV